LHLGLKRFSANLRKPDAGPTFPRHNLSITSHVFELENSMSIRRQHIPDLYTMIPREVALAVSADPDMQLPPSVGFLSASELTCVYVDLTASGCIGCSNSISSEVIRSVCSIYRYTVC
jgi:hypothetical protein